MASLRKAVIPAAGRGTRLFPVARSVPKELLPIVATAAIDHVVAEAIAAGIEEIVLVTSVDKPDLEVHLRAHPAAARVTIVHQDSPLGLGHAVACARGAVGDDAFAVLLPDDLYEPPLPTADLADLYRRGGVPCVSLLEVAPEEVSRYGVVRPSWRRDGVVGIADLVEKPAPGAAPSCLVLPGRYLLEPDVFDALDRTAPGAGGEIQLTDALRALAALERLVGLPVRGRRHDVGHPLGLLVAGVAFGLREPALAPALRAALARLLAPRPG